MPAVDRRRWLMPGGPTPEHRRPLLAREYSAPAVMQMVEDAARDTYESFPAYPRPPILRRITSGARSLVREGERKVEAGLWRLAWRAVFFWVRCCLRRR